MILITHKLKSERVQLSLESQRFQIFYSNFFIDLQSIKYKKGLVHFLISNNKAIKDLRKILKMKTRFSDY